MHHHTRTHTRSPPPPTHARRPALATVGAGPPFSASAVPAGPINSVEQVFADPQVLARGMRLEMDHGLGHPISLPANPIKLSRTPIEYDQAPPLLDEHREQILDAVRRNTTT